MYLCVLHEVFYDDCIMYIKLLMLSYLLLICIICSLYRFYLNLCMSLYFFMNVYVGLLFCFGLLFDMVLENFGFVLFFLVWFYDCDISVLFAWYLPYVYVDFFMHIMYLFIGNLFCINESVLFVLFLMFIDVIFDTFCEACFWHNLLCECFICEAGLLSIFQWTIDRSIF